MVQCGRAAASGWSKRDQIWEYTSAKTCHRNDGDIVTVGSAIRWTDPLCPESESLLFGIGRNPPEGLGQKAKGDEVPLAVASESMTLYVTPNPPPPPPALERLFAEEFLVK